MNLGFGQDFFVLRLFFRLANMQSKLDGANGEEIELFYMRSKEKTKKKILIQRTHLLVVDQELMLSLKIQKMIVNSFSILFQYGLDNQSWGYYRSLFA